MGEWKLYVDFDRDGVLQEDENVIDSVVRQITTRTGFSDLPSVDPSAEVPAGSLTTTLYMDDKYKLGSPLRTGDSAVYGETASKRLPVIGARVRLTYGWVQNGTARTDPVWTGFASGWTSNELDGTLTLKATGAMGAMDSNPCPLAARVVVGAKTVGAIARALAWGGEDAATRYNVPPGGLTYVADGVVNPGVVAGAVGWSTPLSLTDWHPVPLGSATGALRMLALCANADLVETPEGDLQVVKIRHTTGNVRTVADDNVYAASSNVDALDQATEYIGEYRTMTVDTEGGDLFHEYSAPFTIPANTPMRMYLKPPSGARWSRPTPYPYTAHGGGLRPMGPAIADMGAEYAVVYRDAQPSAILYHRDQNYNTRTPKIVCDLATWGAPSRVVSLDARADRVVWSTRAFPRVAQFGSKSDAEDWIDRMFESHPLGQPYYKLRVGGLDDETIALMKVGERLSIPQDSAGAWLMGRTDTITSAGVEHVLIARGATTATPTW